MSQTIVTTDTPVEHSRRKSNTLSILVNNSPGVLMRICQVFSRRAFNIDSLVVSEGRTGAFSRMTIDISGSPEGLDQIIKQVNKLIDVIHCFEHTAENSVVREMLLVKILADAIVETKRLKRITTFQKRLGLKSKPFFCVKIRQARSPIRAIQLITPSQTA